MQVSLPYYYKVAFGSGPIEVGMMFLLFYSPSLLGVLGANITARNGVKWPAFLGITMCVASLLTMCLIPLRDWNRMYIFCSLAVLVLGAGLSMCTCALVTDISFVLMESAECRLRGRAHAKAMTMPMAMLAAGGCMGCYLMLVLHEYGSMQAQAVTLVTLCVIAAIAVLTCAEGRMGNMEQ
jgi:MFS family permease